MDFVFAVDLRYIIIINCNNRDVFIIYTAVITSSVFLIWMSSFLQASDVTILSYCHYHQDQRQQESVFLRHLPSI